MAGSQRKPEAHTEQLLSRPYPRAIVSHKVNPFYFNRAVASVKATLGPGVCLDGISLHLIGATLSKRILAFGLAWVDHFSYSPLHLDFPTLGRWLACGPLPASMPLSPLQRTVAGLQC